MQGKAFISHESSDMAIAEEICTFLEIEGVKCWMAARDLSSHSGVPYARGIMDAMRECAVVVLVFSSNTAQSGHVLRELDLATSQKKLLIPFRIENVEPTPEMAYYLSTPQWLNALTRPLEPHLKRLHEAIQRPTRDPNDSLPSTSSFPTKLDTGIIDKIRSWQEAGYDLLHMKNASYLSPTALSARCPSLDLTPPEMLGYFLCSACYYGKGISKWADYVEQQTEKTAEIVSILTTALETDPGWLRPKWRLLWLLGHRWRDRSANALDDRKGRLTDDNIILLQKIVQFGFSEVSSKRIEELNASSSGNQENAREARRIREIRAEFL